MQVLGEMAAGKNPIRGKDRLTVARAFTRFFEAKPNLAASSVSGYSRTCDLYLRPSAAMENYHVSIDNPRDQSSIASVVITSVTLDRGQSVSVNLGSQSRLISFRFGDGWWLLGYLIITLSPNQ
jgi:hypothetical protein